MCNHKNKSHIVMRFCLSLRVKYAFIHTSRKVLIHFGVF